MRRLPRIRFLVLLGFSFGGLLELLMNHPPTQKSEAGNSPLSGTSGLPISGGEIPTTTGTPSFTLPTHEPPPSVNLAEVIAAQAAERIEKLAIWLATANSAETAAMFEKVSAEDDHPSNRLQIELILQHWVAIDRKAAFHAGRLTIPGGWNCYQAWARLDPRAAWQDAIARDYFAQQNVIKSIAENDPMLAREIMGHWNDPMTLRETSIHSNIAGGMARTQPQAAADYMLSHGAAPVTALKLWFLSEPDAAQAWALSQNTPQRKTAALKRLVAEWNDSHPDKIPALLAGLPEGQSKWAVQATYAQGLARSDPDAAIAYAAQVTSPVARAGILQETAYGLASNQPEGAMRILRTLDWSHSGDAWKEATIAVSETAEAQIASSRAAATLQILAEDHLADALSIAGEVPSGPLQDQAMGAVASSWPKSKSQELSEWLVQQTVPSVREAGAKRLVENLLLDPSPDFDAAARWAATLSLDRKPEDSPLNTVIQLWKGSDPEAANTALVELKIPPALREFLTQPAVP